MQSPDPNRGPAGSAELQSPIYKENETTSSMYNLIFFLTHLKYYRYEKIWKIIILNLIVMNDHEVQETHFQGLKNHKFFISFFTYC